MATKRCRLSVAPKAAPARVAANKEKHANVRTKQTASKPLSLPLSLLLHSPLALLLQFCFVNVIAPSSTNRLFVLFLLYNLHQRVPWGCYAHICTNTRTQQTAQHTRTHTDARAVKLELPQSYRNYGNIKAFLLCS